MHQINENKINLCTNEQNVSFADRVAETCYEHFKRLPKKGKPLLEKEWTLLSAILMTGKNHDFKVVAMTTGTKCLGESQLRQGDILSDSHAEVLTRRAFLRFLYHNMELVLQNKSSDVLLLDKETKRFSLKHDVKFHFFVSHVPCGDAAIFPKASSKRKLSTDFSNETTLKKLKSEEVDTKTTQSNVYIEDSIGDIYRTGAKCVKDGVQDPKGYGKDYHTVGVLRTKPGRGIPTLSMSCSDKIALWNTCGLQGALLSHFLKAPIYPSTFVFGNCPFDEKALERAIYERLFPIEMLPPFYTVLKPNILQSSLMFDHSKEAVMSTNNKAIPCPSAIIWSDVPNPLEVSVNGKKQGVTKKNLGKKTSRVSICRQVLFESFLSIAQKMTDTCDMVEKFDNLTYYQCKQSATDYQAAKKKVFEIFKGWVHKPQHLQMFQCNVVEK